MRTNTLLAVALCLSCSSVDLQAGDTTDTRSGDGTVLDFADTPGVLVGDDALQSDATEGDDGQVAVDEDASAGDAATADTGGTLEGEDGAGSDDVAPQGEDAASQDVTSPPASRCTVSEDTISCSYQTLTLTVGVLSESRDVLYQVPLTPPPAGGYPVAILFHGTQVSPELFWDGQQGGLADLGGLWYQVSTVQALLDAGFAVLTPRSQVVGYWNTNVAPTNILWDSAPDNALMLDLIAAIASGDFGSLDADRLYPAGISSGGYMTSRVALTYAGVRAAAIHSASYMTCAASFCVLGDVTAAHPATLFLHGALDPIVPVVTMELYRDALSAVGVDTKTVVDDTAGHEWLEESPTAIRDWFLAHP